MNRDVYLKFYPDSWRADEQLGECSLAARGLWIELIALANKYGGYVLISGKVPTLEALARAVRATVKEVARLLAELVKEGVCSRRQDGAYFSRRMVRDFERRKQNRANGLKGGNPLLLDNRDDVSSDNQFESTSDNRDSPTIIAIASSSSVSGSADRKEQDPHGATFARFWQRYPNHKAKQDALRAWRKLAPSPELIATIHDALDWQTRQPDWVKQRGQFVPMAATYLNGRRWEDEAARDVSREPIPDWTEECDQHHATRCESRYQHGLMMDKKKAS